MRCSIVVALACSACAGAIHHRPFADDCRSIPQVARELARLDRSSPAVAAQILDEVGEYLHGRGEYATSCDEELADALYVNTFADSPVIASSTLVARLRAIAALPDMIGVMERKARFLLRLARTSDRDFDPPTAGPQIRSLAARAIARSNLDNNDRAAHAFLLDELRTTHDDRERVALAVALEHATGSGPDTAIGAELVRGFVADVDRRLASPPDPWSLEVALLELRMLGAFGPRVGATGAAALVDRVVAAAGRVPLTAGVPGAADDLLITAASAHALIADGGLDPRLALPQPVVPLRTPPSDEPARAEIAVTDDALAHIAELDAHVDPRAHAGSCAPIDALARALPAGEATRRFWSFVAPLFPDERLWIADVALCRLRAALAMEQTTGELRRALIHRVLDREHSAFVINGSDYGNQRVDFDTYVAAIGDALAAHRDWIDADPALRAWLVDRGAVLLDETGRSHLSDDLIDSLALARGLPRAVVYAITRDRDTMRRVVAAWTRSLRTLPHEFYYASQEWFEARLLMVALWAPRVGLDAEARELFAAIRAQTPSPVVQRTQHVAAIAETVLAAHH